MKIQIQFKYKGNFLTGDELEVRKLPGFKHIGILLPKNASESAATKIEKEFAKQFKFLGESPEGSTLIQSLESDRPFNYSGDRFLFGTDDSRVIVPDDINTVYSFFDSDPTNENLLDTVEIIIDGENIGSNKGANGESLLQTQSVDWQNGDFANQAQFTIINNSTYELESSNNAKLSQTFTHETIHCSDNINNIPDENIATELRVNIQASRITFEVDPTAIIRPFYGNVFHDLPENVLKNTSLNSEVKFIKTGGAGTDFDGFLTLDEYRIFRTRLKTLGVNFADDVDSTLVYKTARYVKVREKAFSDLKDFDFEYTKWRDKCLDKEIIIIKEEDDPIAYYADISSGEKLTNEEVAKKFGVAVESVDIKNETLRFAYKESKGAKNNISLEDETVTNVETSSAKKVKTQCVIS